VRKWLAPLQERGLIVFNNSSSHELTSSALLYRSARDPYQPSVRFALVVSLFRPLPVLKDQDRGAPFRPQPPLPPF
jgi:hypothetical protein